MISLADQKAVAQDLARFKYKPYQFVMWAFPWGRKGTHLEHKQPYRWQLDSLKAMEKRIEHWGPRTQYMLDREADIAGNGNGKSAKSVFKLLWAFTTCELTRGFVTSGTADQLATKFWPEMSKWYSLFIARHFFTLTATALFPVNPQYKLEWRVDMQPWSLNHPESGAGMHNEGRRIIKIFEESSQIPDPVWQTAEGSNTDTFTEIIHHVNGNGTRNNGWFAEITFGSKAMNWVHNSVDCRTVENANKQLHDEWIKEYGLDSDFCRTHILGLLPRSSALQFIPAEFLEEAECREVTWRPDDPLVMACDPAFGGEDDCVIRFRLGSDMRTFPTIRIPGSEVRDNAVLEGKIHDIFANPRNYGLPRKPDILIIDASGAGGPVFNNLKRTGIKVLPFVGAVTSTDKEGPNGERLYRNMRAYSWARLRDALRLHAAVDDDKYLRRDITNQEATLDEHDKVMLVKKSTMKSMNLPSPNDGDAAAMLWAFHIEPLKQPKNVWEKAARNNRQAKPYSLKDRLSRARGR
ncbi:MAG TPA: terminase [bacterium]|nr:terminase [bacterium]